MSYRIVLKTEAGEEVIEGLDKLVERASKLARGVHVGRDRARLARVQLGELLNAIAEQAPQGTVLSLYTRIGLHPRMAQRCRNNARDYGDGRGGIDAVKLAQVRGGKKPCDNLSPTIRVVDGPAQVSCQNGTDDSVSFSDENPEPRWVDADGEPCDEQDAVWNIAPTTPADDLKAVGRELRLTSADSAPVFGEQMVLDWNGSVESHQAVIDELEQVRLVGDLTGDREREAVEAINECSARLRALLNANFSGPAPSSAASPPGCSGGGAIFRDSLSSDPGRAARPVGAFADG